ncbi:integrase [Sanguibacteroides justesenii]|uniref:tyrosine-type recombinase/integrase n=1 Tax=Sanguibacteroides justesenii TaxID=1547597 RepID=UPI000D81C51F|nr:site-specific integrase [Sanguibacteroides justesenii]PXZ43103.1 integrase [Sanguibacteroides justesenii]
MTSIKFKLRLSTISGKPATLYIQLIHKREVKTITLPYKLYPYEWNNLHEEVIFFQAVPHRYHYLKEIDKQVIKEKKTLFSIIRQLCEQKSYSMEDILRLYNNRHNEGLFPFIQKKIEELQKRGRFHTARNYRTTSRVFYSFCQRSKLQFEELNSGLLKDFEEYLKTKEIKLNSISFYMRILRSLYNKALEEGFIERDENPFRLVYTGIQKTRKRAVSSNVIANLKKLNLEENDGLNLSKDLFLFSFYTRGMAFIDMAHLLKTSVIGNYLEYTRQKTKQYLRIRITPDLKEILQKYQSLTSGSPYLLPIIRGKNGTFQLQYESAQRLHNKRLKKISELLNLPVPLTSYAAKHNIFSI